MTKTTRTTTKGYAAKVLTALVAAMALLILTASSAMACTTGYGEYTATHGQLCWNDVTYGPFTSGLVTKTVADYEGTQAQANEAARLAAKAEAEGILDGILGDFPRHMDNACPPVTGYGEYTATHGQLCWNDVTYGPFTSGLVTKTLADYEGTQAQANEAARLAAKAEAEGILDGVLGDFPRHIDGACPKPDPCKPTLDPTTNTFHTCMATYPTKWTDTICYADETVPLSKDIIGIGFGSTYEQALAKAKDNADWQLKIMNKVMPKFLDREYPGYTEGACPGTDTFGAASTWTITTDICYNGGFETNTVTATKDVTGFDKSSAAYAAAETSARTDAEAQMATFLAARPGYTIAPPDGVCTASMVESTPVTAVEAATVAAPAPATVTAPEPAKVAAPAAATVPEAVPAGDGSSAPQTPVWMLALLGLGTLGLALGGARIAIQRRI